MHNGTDINYINTDKFKYSIFYKFSLILLDIKKKKQ